MQTIRQACVQRCGCCWSSSRSFRWSAHVTIIDKKEVQQALNYDPGSKAFLNAFLLAVACLIIWYVVPGIDTNLFRTIALSVSAVGLTLFTVYYVQVFQKHLDVN